MALRPLTVGDRVAHREDSDWKKPTGAVTDLSLGSEIGLHWDGFAHTQYHDRTELVAHDDPDIEATDEAPLNLDGTPFV